MDPKKISTNQSPPAKPEIRVPQPEVPEPAFERWQRITEALIADANPGPESPIAGQRSPSP